VRSLPAQGGQALGSRLGRDDESSGSLGFITSMKNPPWKTIKPRTVFRSQYLNVREDDVRRPDGTTGRYAYIEHGGGGGVGVVVYDARGRIYLTKEYKYPVRAFGYHLPSGGIEPGERPLVSAKRELKEETGFTAKTWRALGTLATTDGSSDEIAYLFLVQDITAGKVMAQPLEPMTIVRMPLKKAVQMALDGRITCSYAVAGILRAAAKLKML